MSSTARDRASVAAHAVSLLRTPVLELAEVPGLLGMNDAQRASWADCRVYRRDAQGRYDWIYFGRGPAAQVKIGISYSAANRLNAQRLEPLLLIYGARAHHERELHEFFADEHVRGEMFRGPRVREFIRAAAASASSRFDDWSCSRYWRARIKSLEWLVTGEERVQQKGAA